MSVLVVHFNNLNATAGFIRHTVGPHSVNCIHLLIQCDTSGEVQKVKHDVHIARVIFQCVPKIDSRPMHIEHESRFWRHNDAENF